jgi:hypothetical protein
MADSLLIFLCHASEDKEKVRKLYRQLRGLGFNPWLDAENLLPGQEWELKISEIVRRCDVVLVCLSQSSINKRGFVQREINYALNVADEQPEGAVFIIPAKLEECEVPHRLSKWQWVNLYEPEGYDRLIKSLRNKAQKSVNTDHSDQIITFTGYMKNVLELLWNDGEVREITTQEILQKLGQGAYANNRKLGYAPWELIKTGSHAKARVITPRGIDFVSGNLKIPRRIIKVSDTNEWIAVDETDMISFLDIS